MVTVLTSPSAADIVVAALGAATTNREVGDLARDFFADRYAREQPVFERAPARGELRADVDPMVLVDLLAGAAWVRIALRRLPVEEDFVARTVGTVLHGAGMHGSQN